MSPDDVRGPRDARSDDAPDPRGAEARNPRDDAASSPGGDAPGPPGAEAAGSGAEDARGPRAEEAAAPSDGPGRWAAAAALRRWLPHAATALAALVLTTWFARLLVEPPGPAAVAEPERALARVVSRVLDLGEAAQRAPGWERRLYALTIADRAADLEQALAWYAELAAASADPLVELRLAILEGEAGRLEALRARLEAWAAGGTVGATWVALLRSAYLDGPVDAEAVPLLEPWFRDRIRARLAARAGDAAARAAVDRDERRRLDAVLGRLRVYLLVEGLVATAGLVALARALARRRGDALAVAAAPLPPPWPAGAGAVVLLWGGALDVGLARAAVAVWQHAPAVPLPQLALATVPALPMLWLARRRLLAPAGLDAARAFGLRPRPRGGRALVTATAVLLAAGQALDLLLGAAVEAFGLTSHWTEWFDEALVFGDLAAALDTLVVGVVVAPVLEEVVFRGLLFATLRRRLAWPAAAAASALVFALAHGYGAVGATDVFLSGVLWAWAYERTGSLLPGMAAHALGNLFVALTNVWFLR